MTQTSIINTSQQEEKVNEMIHAESSQVDSGMEIYG
jgi:hypothetical protein